MSIGFFEIPYASAKLWLTNCEKSDIMQIDYEKIVKAAKEYKVVIELKLKKTNF